MPRPPPPKGKGEAGTKIEEIGDSKSIPSNAPPASAAKAVDDAGDAGSSGAGGRQGWKYAPKWKIHILSPELTDKREIVCTSAEAGNGMGTDVLWLWLWLRLWWYRLV